MMNYLEKLRALALVCALSACGGGGESEENGEGFGGPGTSKGNSFQDFNGSQNPWAAANVTCVGSVVDDVFFDPSGRLYLMGIANVFYSDDRTESFTHLYSSPSGVTFSHARTISGDSMVLGATNQTNPMTVKETQRVFFSDDRGETYRAAHMEDKSRCNPSRVSDIEVHNGRVYISYSQCVPYGLAITSDNGASFRYISTENGLATNAVKDIFFEGSRMYLATSLGIAVSDDDGTSFRMITEGLPHQRTTAVYAKDNHLLVGTIWGLAVSHDGGANFSVREKLYGIRHNSINSIDTAPNGDIYVSLTDGIARTRDYGDTFRIITTHDGFAAASVQGAAFIDDFVIAGTTQSAIYSHDNGETWDVMDWNLIKGTLPNGSLCDLAPDLCSSNP